MGRVGSLRQRALGWKGRRGRPDGVACPHSPFPECKGPCCSQDRAKNRLSGDPAWTPGPGRPREGHKGGWGEGTPPRTGAVSPRRPSPHPPWSCTSPAQSEEPGAQARTPVLGVGCTLAPRETPLTSWLHWPSAPRGQGPMESLESSPSRGLEPSSSLQESLVKGVAGCLCPSQAPEPELPIPGWGGGTG